MTKEKLIELGVEEGDTINIKGSHYKYAYLILQLQLERGFIKLENETDGVSFWMEIDDVEIINHTPYKNLTNTNFEAYKKPCVFSEVKNWCHLSKKDDFIEVCRWGNTEGLDITINDTTISLTDGQLELINALIKKLDDDNN